MPRNKSAVELSVNFLVIIILSITIFGFGIKFVYDIFDKAIDLQKMTEKELDDQIGEMNCQPTEMICLPKDMINMRLGQLEIIGIRILNMDRALPEINFITKVELVKFISKDGTTVKEPGPTDWADYDVIEVYPNSREDLILQNKEKKLAIGFQVPKNNVPKGTYVFDISVWKENNLTPLNLYDGTHKVRIIVN